MRKIKIIKDNRIELEVTAHLLGTVVEALLSVEDAIWGPDPELLTAAWLDDVVLCLRCSMVSPMEPRLSPRLASGTVKIDISHDS